MQEPFSLQLTENQVLPSDDAGTQEIHHTGFRKQINSSRLSFAPPEYMKAYLDLTPGSASILGLMNDHDHHVQLVMDQEVVNQPLIGCHPCINTSSLTLSTNDVLNKFLPYTDHNVLYVNL